MKLQNESKVDQKSKMDLIPKLDHNLTMDQTSKMDQIPRWIKIGSNSKTGS